MVTKKEGTIEIGLWFIVLAIPAEDLGGFSRTHMLTPTLSWPFQATALGVYGAHVSKSLLYIK